MDYLGECAKQEVLCHPGEDFGAPVSLLRRAFGPWETVTSLQSARCVLFADAIFG